MTTFRDRVESAIESREPLDTPELRRLSFSGTCEEREWWQEQVRIDRAIGEWQSEFCPSQPLRWNARRLAAALAVTAAGLLAGWFAASDSVPDSNQPVRPASVPGEVASVPTVSPIAPKPRVETDAFGPSTLATHQFKSDQFAEAAETAGRLAYAFEPVGERVGTVVRFLVDSVPGSDVFAM